MKIAGQKIDLNARTTVRIPRPGAVLEIEVHTFPYGFDLEEDLPVPQPPKSPRRDKEDRPIRDADGRLTLFDDFNDAGYVRERKAWARRINAAVFYYATAASGRVQFESLAGQKPPAGDRPAMAVYFDKAASELEASGFTPGDVTLVANAAYGLSNMVPNVDVERYLADFSQGGKSPTDTGSPDSKTPEKAGPSSTLFSG
jgi:hypothetical protein